MTNADDNASEFDAQPGRESSEASEQNDASDEDIRQELNDALGDLRAELAQVQIEEARDRVRTWIRDNPLLALALAAGAGVLSGRLIAKALKPSPPPPLSERARRQLEALRKRAERTASDVGQDVSKRLAQARKEAERVGREAGETLSHRARDWQKIASERAASLRDQAAEELSEATKSASKQAEKTAERARASAKDLSEKASSSTKGWFARMGPKIAKTAAIAWAAKKLGNWVRRGA